MLHAIRLDKISLDRSLPAFNIYAAASATRSSNFSLPPLDHSIFKAEFMKRITVA